MAVCGHLRRGKRGEKVKQRIDCERGKRTRTSVGPRSKQTLLSSLQRIVELQESWRIMVEFNTHGGAGQQYQEHKVQLWMRCGLNSSVFTEGNHVYCVSLMQAGFCPALLKKASKLWPLCGTTCRIFVKHGSCVHRMIGSQFSGGHSCSAGGTRWAGRLRDQWLRSLLVLHVTVAMSPLQLGFPCSHVAGLQPDNSAVWGASEHRSQHASDGVPVGWNPVFITNSVVRLLPA